MYVPSHTLEKIFINLSSSTIYSTANSWSLQDIAVLLQENKTVLVEAGLRAHRIFPPQIHGLEKGSSCQLSQDFIKIVFKQVLLKLLHG